MVQPGEPTDPRNEGADAEGGVEGLSDAEVGRAEELHSLLAEDPNDVDAFGELAELVRRNAFAVALADPLRAEDDAVDPQKDANLAVWALGEELAGQPKAWYPLLELARLSLPEDIEGAVRRLTSASERETSGRALTESVRILREAGRPVEAYNLGVAHWNPAEQAEGAGRELVLAALDAQRPLDAKRLLGDLEEAGSEEAARTIEELRPRVEDALAGN